MTTYIQSGQMSLSSLNTLIREVLLSLSDGLDASLSLLFSFLLLGLGYVMIVICAKINVNSYWNVLFAIHISSPYLFNLPDVKLLKAITAAKNCP